MPSGVEIAKHEESSEMEHSSSGQEDLKGRSHVSNDGDEEMEQASATREQTSAIDTGDASEDQHMSQENEEGVEVVLGDRGSTKVVDNGDNKGDIFRHPQAVRPRAVRAPGSAAPPQHPPPHGRHGYGPPPQPYLHGSGSWGYGHPPPHPPPPGHHHRGEYPPPPARPYPVPPYTSSGSFDEQGYHHHPPPHYSPHVQYPPPGGRYPSEEVNVISPNHKGDPHYRPPLTPRPRHMPPPPQQSYYHYPPTSPVSRPAGSQTSPGRPGVSQQSGPPRVRNYAMQRGDGAYARAQRPGDPYHPPPPEEGSWSQYPPHGGPPKGERKRNQPPVVAESFDSEHHSHRSPHPNGPPPAAPPPPHDPHYQFYGAGGSWNSFDSSAQPPPTEDPGYYQAFPPDSPYSPYPPPYSPGAQLYRSESFPPPPGYGPPTPMGGHHPHPPPPPPPPQSTGSFSYSYDEDDRYRQDYGHDRDEDGNLKHVTPPGAKGKGSKGGGSMSSSSRNMILPKAAEEIDFDVTDPPMEPILPPGEEPSCETLADVNGYDVLCGRGGGTNSQIGNRRFRKLVQEFQPTYLMAKRKEKPLLARTIVLIIRKRGGRFLKKNEDTGELFEVGDTKAEAKTSQALREGLDVRATKSAANSLVDKKKKKKSGKSLADEEDDDLDSPSSSRSTKKETNSRVESPPTLPRLQGEEVKSGPPHPHSPDQSHIRKRRRMRSMDRFFPDFCPPRAEIGRTGSPTPGGDRDDGVLDITTTPLRRNSSRDDETMRYEGEPDHHPQGCAGIALDIVTGAAAGSFCLGPQSWRS